MERVATYDVLVSLGFSEDPSVLSEGFPGLSFDFRNLKLCASHLLNLYFQPVVSFTGVMHLTRAMSNVVFEIPQSFATQEECAAFLAWNLDQHAGGNSNQRSLLCGWS